MNDIILTKWERQLMLALKKHEEVVLGDIPPFYTRTIQYLLQVFRIKRSCMYR